MIYTSSLGLSAEQRRPRSGQSLRSSAARACSVVRQAVEVIREAIVKARAALAADNGFGAQ